MKTIIKLIASACVLFALCLSAHAQGATAFTYQGQLHDTGTNANGAYAMIFALYDAATSGNQVGSPITNCPALANGLFSVNLDFGAGAFNGSARWLDITITNGATTQELSPRVQVLPTPYAQFAAVAATVTNGAIMNAQLAGNAVATTNIQMGAVTTAQIAAGAVTNAQLAVDAVATTNIQNGAVNTLQIANGAVGSAQLAPNLTVGGTLVVSNSLQIGGTLWNVNVENFTFPDGGPSFSNSLVFSANGSPYLDLLPAPPYVPGVCAPNGLFTVGLNSRGNIVVSDTNWNAVAQIDPGGNITTDGNITMGGSIVTTGGMSASGNIACNWLAVSNEITCGYLTVNGFITAVSVNAGSFNTTSDRNLKENFTATDNQAILERVASLPISRWNFKTDAQTRHIGPMAQDFYAAFNVGTDDKHIATVDEDGVALAAIQGLNEKLKAKDAQIEALAKRLADLEQWVKTSAQK